MSGRYVNARPQFDFQTGSDGLIKANVTLPIAVSPALRHARSEMAWITENQAKKDAAFQAYKALYQAGLINENLLPLRRPNDGPEFNVKDDRASTEKASAQINPWISMVLASGSEWCKYSISIRSESGELISRMITLVPGYIPYIPPYTVFWSHTSTYEVAQEPLGPVSVTDEQINLLGQITHLIHIGGIGARLKSNNKDFVVLLSPSENIEPSILKEWLSAAQGVTVATKFCGNARSAISSSSRQAIVREIGREADPHVLQDFFLGSDNTTDDEWVLAAVKFPKRRDFLHPLTGKRESQNAAYRTVKHFDASACTIDNMPVSAATFAILLPCILHRFEIYMIAKSLQTDVLAPVGIVDTHLVLTAITTTAAGEHVNYQRLEYLGDCILKFSTSISLTALHLTWPESYLTAEKGRTNSNGYLCRASLAAGLDCYIVRNRFTGVKWQPLYTSQVLDADTRMEAPKSDLSTKTLADVIESLIGASYMDGGLTKSLKCIQTLLPNESWLPFDVALDKLYTTVPDDLMSSSLRFEKLEALVGYTFRRKHLLLEAITHPSFTSYREALSSSYQRLEFLGDAVLDYIVSSRLHAHSPPLPHHLMHRIRTAMVNGPFLAFLAFELSIPEDRINITINAATKQPEKTHETVKKMLWQFMRQTSPQIPLAQQAAVKRHDELKDEILAALYGGSEGREYPWSLLCRTGADKFFSDLVESIIGAIFIDASPPDADGGRGGLDAALVAVESFVSRLGILSILAYILENDVDCLHPKERLGQLAVGDEVRYVRVQDDVEVERGLYGCIVKVGDREVGGLVVERTRFEAETEAAWRAAAILMREEAGGVASGAMQENGQAEDGDEEEEDVWMSAEEGDHDGGEDNFQDAMDID